jgi:mono/diheme cytochrome c family protein
MRKFLCGFVLGLLLIPVAAMTAGMLGRFPVSATDSPSRWESFFARKALAATVERQAPKVQNPIQPTSANLAAGMKFYRDGCAGCHGDANRRSNWGTAYFYPRVPQFGFEPPLKPDWQMFWIVSHGVRNTGMGGWGGLTSDDNIWKTVTFLSRLRDLPPDVEAQWRGQQPSQ